MEKILALLEAASRCHQNGDMAAAEQQYLEILGLDPQHAQSLYQLGTLKAQVCYRQALAVDETNADAFWPRLSSSSIARSGIPGVLVTAPESKKAPGFLSWRPGWSICAVNVLSIDYQIPIPVRLNTSTSGPLVSTLPLMSYHVVVMSVLVGST